MGSPGPGIWGLGPAALTPSSPALELLWSFGEPWREGRDSPALSLAERMCQDSPRKRKGQPGDRQTHTHTVTRAQERVSPRDRKKSHPRQVGPLRDRGIHT